MFHVSEKTAVCSWPECEFQSQDKRRNHANIWFVNEQALWRCWFSFKIHIGKKKKKAYERYKRKTFSFNQNDRYYFILRSTLKIYTQCYINIHNVLKGFYAWPNSMYIFAKQSVNILSEVHFHENVKFYFKKFKCKLSSAVNKKFT